MHTSSHTCTHTRTQTHTHSMNQTHEIHRVLPLLFFFFFSFLTLSIIFYSSSFGSCELHVCVLFSEKAAMPANLVNSNKVQQQQLWTRAFRCRALAPISVRRPAAVFAWTRCTGTTGLVKFAVLACVSTGSVCTTSSTAFLLYAICIRVCWAVFCKLLLMDIRSFVSPTDLDCLVKNKCSLRRKLRQFMAF